MMTVCALLLTLFGAVLVYLAHVRQQLLPIALPTSARVVGAALIAAGSVAWLNASGSSAGVAGAMTTVMCTWVVLPYIAWWLGRHIRVLLGKRS